ncbi:unnamed protein product, partial [Prorocentrum cordatum]
EEEEEEESQGGAFHSRAVSRRGGGWVRLRCAAGRSARGARGPLGAPLRGLACGARGQRAGGHRPAAGRPAWGAIIVRCPSEVGTSRAPVGSCEPGLALAEDGEGEQERRTWMRRKERTTTMTKNSPTTPKAQPDQEQVDARTLLGAALAQQNDARGHWARAALLHGNH